MGPSDCAKENANLIEVVDISEFSERSSIQIWLEVKDACPAILNFKVEAIIREGLH
jgi:hypothetical protein